jgi:hypothetical protein
VLKLNHGADGQVGSIRPCLVQSWHGEQRIIYPLIITALKILCRTITTNSPIPITTPLTAPVLGDVAGSLYPMSSSAYFKSPFYRAFYRAIYNLCFPFFREPATTSLSALMRTQQAKANAARAEAEAACPDEG